MRSLHADRFNHDADATGYDADVRDETNPIRAGYAEALRWVAREAAVSSTDRVLELGSGTGNLTELLGPAGEIVCVDVSTEMGAIAREKLAARPRAAATPYRFVDADLLEALDVVDGAFDVVASTYAVHHLTEEEKTGLFATVRRRLSPGGRAVFGDLMFESTAARAETLAKLRQAGDEDSIELAETIEDEFFWDLARATAELRGLGFAVHTHRFSELSWGVAATLPGL